MDGRSDGRCNPVYIPRNHLVEEALEAATAGDLGRSNGCSPSSPTRSTFAGLERYAAPAPASWGSYRTFCGT